MAKYDALRDRLKASGLNELILTFREMTTLVGALPPSADRPQWWANVRDPAASHVQRRAWGDAGYDAFLISGASKVRFVRRRP